MKKIIKWIFLFLSVICLILFLTGETSSRTVMNASDIDSAFSFSLENGFYDSSIHVGMDLASHLYHNLQIRYTMDGSTPVPSSSLYETPLIIDAKEDMQAVSVKAIVCNGDTVLGGPYNATYFVGNKASSWTNALVVSITADNDDLFSPEKGILYPAADCGPTEADWKWFEKQNCKQRGDEWIRNAHIDIFEPDGSNVVSQEIGLCVDGDHGSMTHYPYSLKILAGKEYDKTNPAFTYRFFDYYNTDGTDFPHIQNYNNLVFRNGGNEYNAGVGDPEQRGTMLRWNVGSRLADEAGFLTAGARPALIYLNGELYGAAQLQDTYNRYNTGRRTELNKDKIELYKNAEKACTELGGYSDLYYRYPDLENSPIFDNMKEFEETVSMDDMFLYYAYELLVNNTDYPKKNYAIWRYNGNEDSSNPFTDGKYRFLMNDLDCTYDFRYDDDLWVAYFSNIKEDGTLMGTLMQIEKYRIQFINILCDLMNSGLFSSAHLDQVINEANSQFGTIASLYYTPEDESKRQQNVLLLKESAFARLNELTAYLNETFAPKYPYVLSAKAPYEGTKIRWSTTELVHSDGDYTGTYYGDYPLTLTCDTNDYRKFSHWLVNGQKVWDPTLTLDNSLIKDQTITVELVTESTESNGIIINEVCADPDGAWVELFNPSEKPMDLSIFALSNNIPSLFKFKLPEIILEPGEIFVAGIDNTGLFRLETGRTVYLSQAETGRILDTVFVPSMADKESYGRFGETNEFRYYINPTQGTYN